MVREKRKEKFAARKAKENAARKARMQKAIVPGEGDGEQGEDQKEQGEEDMDSRGTGSSMGDFSLVQAPPKGEAPAGGGSKRASIGFATLNVTELVNENVKDHVNEAGKFDSYHFHPTVTEEVVKDPNEARSTVGWEWKAKACRAPKLEDIRSQQKAQNAVANALRGLAEDEGVVGGIFFGESRLGTSGRSMATWAWEVLYVEKIPTQT